MKTLIAACVFCASAAQALAQTCEDQRQLLAAQWSAGGVSIVEPGTLDQEGETCVLRGLRLSTGSYLQVPVAEITWKFDGLTQALGGQIGPVSIDVSVSGVQIITTPPDKAVAYLMALQQRDNLINGRLEMGFDPVTGQLDLAAFRVDFPDKSHWDLTGRVGGINVNPLVSINDLLLGLTLERLDLSVHNNGYLDSFAFGLLTGLLGGTDDPEELVEDIKTQTIIAIGNLPDPIFDPATRGALASLVADGPLPRGGLELTVQGPTGFAFAGLPAWTAQGDPFSAQALTPLLSGTEIRATYTPWAPPE